MSNEPSGHAEPVTTKGVPKTKYEIAIIGGGIMGLSIAYQLARLGLTDVVVFERSYLTAGASGRNGGGVRMQWSTALNVQLMKQSIALCRDFASEMGINIWFRQDGYLFLAKSDDEQRQLEKHLRAHEKLGVPSRWLSPSEVISKVPEISPRDLRGGVFNPEDGVVFPWPFLWGYAGQAQARGVEIFSHTAVTGVEREASHFLLHTARGKVRARRVIHAAGAWSPELAAQVGIDLPTHPHRHEILSTEPLRPFLAPLVSRLSTGLYFSQSMRGEIVTGITPPESHDPGNVFGSRLKFLTKIARELVETVPILADVKVLRQWAGPYDISPDGKPIVGEPKSCPGFFLACGFVGYGFMMAPIVGKLYAEWLMGGAKHEIFDQFRLERFQEEPIEREEMMLG